MDERTIGPGFEAPPPQRRTAATTVTDRALDDPRALTILTTEHWSLLSARSLVYNEAFSRAGMFLTFLSATLVALGLVSAGTGFSRQFLVLSAVVLSIDLFVGLATVGRIASASAEDIRYLQGMNRLRHAYHEIVPGLERYFIAGKHDDVAGTFAVYGATTSITSRRGIVHGFTTTPGMIFVICAVLAGGIAGMLLLLATDNAVVAGLGALVTLLAFVASSTSVLKNRMATYARTMESIFPTPQAQQHADPAETAAAANRGPGAP